MRKNPRLRMRKDSVSGDWWEMISCMEAVAMLKDVD